MKWISVKEKLPGFEGKVLVFNKPRENEQSYIGYRILPCEVVKYCDKETVWAPLPSPPEDK